MITPQCFSPEGATGKKQQKTELYVLAPQLPLRKRRGRAGFRNTELIIQTFPKAFPFICGKIIKECNKIRGHAL